LKEYDHRGKLVRRCRRRTAYEVVLSEVERAQLEHIVACDTRAHHEVQRAKLVLMAAEGLSNAEIGRRRLIQTGAVPITWAAMVAEPQRDWAREQPLPGVAQLQAQPCGGSGIAFPWETQLLATPGPGVGAPPRRSPTDPNRQRRGPTPGAPPPARRSDSLRERQSEPRSRRRSSWTTSKRPGSSVVGFRFARAMREHRARRVKRSHLVRCERLLGGGREARIRTEAEVRQASPTVSSTLQI
jgi:hypothetical protein